MKKCYLDANVLLYFTSLTSQFHDQAVKIIYNLITQGWQLFISPLTLDEYFHNALRFSVVSKSEAFKDLKKSFTSIMKLEKIMLIQPPLELKKHKKIFNLMVHCNLHARDAYHLFIMKENKIKFMATFDSDFKIVFQKGLIKQFK